MTAKQFLDKYKKIVSSFILGNIYFLSVEHHFFQYWEKPGRVMVGTWLIYVPLLTWLLIPIIERFQLQFRKINNKLLFIFLIPAILISAAITWNYYSVPATFHTITITPRVAQNQKVELLEIKANGDIIPPNEKKALEHGWQLLDNTLVATSKSQPLPISFKAEIDAPVTALFFASPQSGTAQISFENEQVDVDLKNVENGQKTSTIYTRSYRGISNWLFIPLLVIVDILAIGSLLLLIFFLQEADQKRLKSNGVVIINHRRNIIILLGVASTLHLLNALAVPLLIDADSPSYLQGALHWLEFGNLDGVSMIRGPGSTFLLMPFVLLFGRNPWGIKILLHLLALACVPVSYRVGWQLGKNQWMAIVSGLVTVLSPDLFFYSNFLMSDLPNLFFVLVFCSLLISALNSFKAGWVIAAMFAGTFAALFRSENITLLFIGAGSLFVACIWQWKTKGFEKPIYVLSMIIIALIIAILPLLGWSAHNHRVYGFFGLSNYAGEVFYDGWVYFGDASGLDFSDQNLQASQKIKAVIDQYPIVITDKSGVPTGWEIYPSLIKAGYTTKQGFDLLKQNTLDSMKKDWSLTYKLLLIKIRAGLRPETTATISLSLPSENHRSYKQGYFDDEQLSIPVLILAQRKTYEYIQSWYDGYFPWWVYLCMFSMFFSLYRSPSAIWLTLILIIATRIFIPNIMGLSHWRYTLAGLIPLQIIGIRWVTSIIQGGKTLFSDQSIEEEKIHSDYN